MLVDTHKISHRVLPAAVFAALFATSAHAQIAKLGAIGDSLSDEYAEEGYGWYADAWTELLVFHRGVTMGPTAAQAGVGHWGEPRRTGYEDNWARYGQTADGAISAGQHTGLASGVTGRGVSHAVMYIGANDFSPWAGSYGVIYSGSWSAQEIADYLEYKESVLRAHLDVVVPTGVKLVLCPVMDLGHMPYVRSIHPDGSRRELNSAVLAQFRDRVRGLADEYDVTFLDLFELSRAIFGPSSSPRTTLLVGNVPITLTGSGIAASNGWVDDGIHPHTVVQGIWASAMMTAFNLGYGTGLTLFTEAEILANAGLTYGGSDTLAGVIGDYAQYVTVFGCAADFNGDGFLSGDDFDQYVSAFENGENSADFNGDGFVSGDDFDAFVAAFEAGC